MNSTAALPVTTYSPASTSEAQELARGLPKVLPLGSQSKPALLNLADPTVARLDMTKLAGISEYDPGEYTFTAFAGTRLAEITAALAENGQYMPFDPPFVDQGATLGGTIAAGLSGSGRYRYGGLRDFILGVHLIDGRGRLVRGGGKVVKNAAGFDLPKLLTGSLGRLGIIVSASFKVFPAPLSTATLAATLPNLQEALGIMARLMGGPYDLEALDLLPQADGSVTLQVRIGGPADILTTRLDRLRAITGNGEALLDDKKLWADVRGFTWLGEDDLLVKTPATALSLPALDSALQAVNVQRRYAVGGNLAWIAWRDSAEACHQLLARLGLSGVVLRGQSERVLIGKPIDDMFLSRVRAALDPDHHFVDFE